jgi:hypothetical protein
MATQNSSASASRTAAESSGKTCDTKSSTWSALKTESSVVKSRNGGQRSDSSKVSIEAMLSWLDSEHLNA